ncbi:DUF5993 family protein [Salinispora fenicalii]|uniref:DUF5993 family protein n=1 Tax=Salinispora fenicalii TaxID=1137263 RepID=UPI00037466ED|nr:DUF5993 family protein [Salinispora fenicalii]
MAILIFAVLLLAGWLTVRGSGRGTILAVWAVALCAVLVVFNHHMAAKLSLNF